MKFIFTSDWQVDWSIVDTCKVVWEFCVDVCVKRKLDGIGVLGDLKHQYNPVDIRVTKFWIWAIGYAKEKGLRVIFILGNHDRVGQYSDAQNWLSIFTKAGAETFDKPAIIPTRDGSRLFILPFDSSPARLRGSAESFLERKPDSKWDILVFHANLKGCMFNQLGQRSEAAIRVKDLYPSRYQYCIGGDIHLPQVISRNVYYCGSPFPMDWGEANQEKRIIVVNGDQIESVPSPIPGWYDPTWPGFPNRERTSWTGAKIRIHVRCSVSEDYNRAIQKARRRAEFRYKGATIYTVTEFEDTDKASVKIKTTDPDSVKIRAYVKETLPPVLEVEEKKIVNYLAYQLDKAAGGLVRHGQGLEFKSATAVNFLSFKKLEFDYTQKGLVVVQGTNQDWHQRSNGSGKTNLLQPIPVALFGTTFKGQKFDKWSRRFTKHQATVTLRLVDSKGRKVKVVRTRRPGSLKLYLNGKDKSSGLRGNAKDATQGMIEQITGFSWQTLANAVYIDQTVTRAFLGGTRKERTDVLSKFQNLERFEKALVQVREDKASLNTELARNHDELTVCLTRIQDMLATIADTQQVVKSETIEARSKWQEAISVAEKATKKLRKFKVLVNDKLGHYKDAYNRLSEQLDFIQHRKGRYELERRQLFTKIKSVEKLDSECPLCHQPIDQRRLDKKVKQWRVFLAKAEKKITGYDKLYRETNQEMLEAEGHYDDWKLRYADKEKAVQGLDNKAAYLGSLYRKLKAEGTVSSKAVRKYKKQLDNMRKKKQVLRRYDEDIKGSLRRIEYCEQALSRNGIPAFLNQQLVPVLNKSAAYYAELFGDKYIQVRFQVIDGEFEPQIINASGGELLDDQSVGERALAGLITSFALREIAPVCNLLVLDEPGDGLDAVNARKFAQALHELKDRFGLILLTTHNSHILSELSGEKTITVQKKNRVSVLNGQETKRQ